MKCRRCNRTLKNPTYIKLGIGRICLKKENAEAMALEQKQADRCDLPFDSETRNIMCQRDADGILHFNIPQTHRHHSPSGFEWGYPGSGPADFALNILTYFVEPSYGDPVAELWDKTFVSERVWRLHQDFKADVVARLPRAGGTLYGVQIQAWVNNKLKRIKASDQRFESGRAEQAADEREWSRDYYA